MNFECSWKSSKEKKWKLGIITLFLLSVLVLCYFYTPLITGIVLGFVFAYVARPIKRWFEMDFQKNVSAAVATAIVITPIALIFIFGILEAVNQFIWVLQHVESFQRAVLDLATTFRLPEFLREYIEMNFPKLFDHIRAIIPSLAGAEQTKKVIYLFLNFFISIFVCYYFLVDGHKIYGFILSLVPEERVEEVRRFLARADRMLSGLFIGNFFTSIIISLMSVPFFLFFKISMIALLASLMFLAALIPIFAEWMVLIPVALYVLITRGVGDAFIFFISGTIFLYLIPEIILRPYFVSYTSDVNPGLLLLAFLGGGIVGGIAGFFLAPTFLVIATAFYREFIYESCETAEGGD